MRNHLRWRSRRHDPDGRYGTLQKTSYLILIFVFVPLMILTGIAQSPGFSAAMPFLLDLFGGRQTARTLHTIGTVMLVLFVAVHVLQVAAAGFFTKVRSMITGIGAAWPWSHGSGATTTLLCYAASYVRWPSVSAIQPAIASPIASGWSSCK